MNRARTIPSSNITAFIIFLLTFIVRFYFLNDILYTAIGVSFSVAVVFSFIQKLGKELPIKEYILMVAVFQWIIGAKVSYNLGKVHYKYYMYVNEQEYMSIVVPGVLLLGLGLSFFKSDLGLARLKLFVKQNREKVKKIGYTLVIVGLAAKFSTKLFIIPGTGFFIYLLDLSMYVGAVHLMMVFYSKRWIIFSITVSYVFLLSLFSGLFHNLFLVAAFLACFVFKEKSSLLTKLSLALSGMAFVIILQTVKEDYRTFAWSENKDKNYIEFFFDLIYDQYFSINTVDTNYLYANREKEAEYSGVTNRLNQGWIISKVFHNVPEKRPFLEGETIYKSIEAAILPRFLAPNKKGGAYAKEMFQEITGLRLINNTSMGLSVIGEFYANYGSLGSGIALFVYGLFLSLTIRFLIVSTGSNSPLILIWFILFFFQTVKAESNFITVFNHLIKGIVFFYIIRFLFTQLNISLDLSFILKRNGLSNS